MIYFSMKFAYRRRLIGHQYIQFPVFIFWRVSVIKIHRRSFPYVQIHSTKLSHLANVISVILGIVSFMEHFKVAEI